VARNLRKPLRETQRRGMRRGGGRHRLRDHPGAAGELRPRIDQHEAAGLALVLLTLGVGLLTSQLVYRTLGASQGEPGPMLAFFCICVVVTTFFWTIGFGGWPFTAVFSNSVAAGVRTWLACYIVGFGVYWTFSDFAFLQGAPVYVPTADPGGLFNAWDVVVVYMAALTILFAWLCFDCWPSRARRR
jgi:hypothetical protein